MLADGANRYPVEATRVFPGRNWTGSLRVTFNQGEMYVDPREMHPYTFLGPSAQVDLISPGSGSSSLRFGGFRQNWILNR